MLSHVGMVLGLSSPVGLRSGVWLAAFLRLAVWPFRWMVCDSGDAARGGGWSWPCMPVVGFDSLAVHDHIPCAGVGFLSL